MVPLSKGYSLGFPAYIYTILFLQSPSYLLHFKYTSFLPAKPSHSSGPLHLFFSLLEGSICKYPNGLLPIHSDA